MYQGKKKTSIEVRTQDTWSDFDVTLLKLCELRTVHFLEMNLLSKKLEI